VRRAPFIAALLGGAMLPLVGEGGARAAAAGSSAPDVELPAVFRGGRPFLKLTSSDGSKVSAWLDTDGSGFVSKTLVDRLHLPVSGGRASLPSFAEQLPPLGGDGALPVVDTLTPKDPILEGVDVQLGGTWFAGRVWTIDYRNERIIWHADGHSVTEDAIQPIKMIFPNGPYPVIPVVVEGELIKMNLDTAASVVGRTGFIAATSFITQARFTKWRTAHPEWTVRAIAPGVDGIDAPGLRVASFVLGNTSFTTRPNDDVFQGETVEGKLGSNAWAFRVLMLDYVRGLTAFN
jgi:hypothetical protein